MLDSPRPIGVDWAVERGAEPVGPRVPRKFGGPTMDYTPTATGIALLRIIDPKNKSKTVEEFGLAYVGFAPVEIAMAIVAPVLIIQGFGWAFIVAGLVSGVGVLAMTFVLGWNRLDDADQPTRS